MKTQELIQKYFVGSISDSERSELYSELKKQPELLKEFLLEAHLENSLENCFQDPEANIIEFPEVYDSEITIDDLRDVSAAGIQAPPEKDNN